MMGRSTVRAALATVEAADAAASLADLPRLLLPELMTAFGADSALWTELDRTAGSLPSRVVANPEPLLNHEAATALEQHAPDFPLTRHTRPGGDGRPVRRSDLQSMRDFRNSGMYADVAQKINVDQVLATALTTGVGLHVCIALNRAGPDFTSGAVDLLTQLRPLLARRVAQLYANPADRLTAGEGSTWPGQADLTPRQQQVLRLMAGGLTDAVIGRRLGCSPRTVDKHLEHIYRKLGVSCRTAAIAAVYKSLQLTGPDARTSYTLHAGDPAMPSTEQTQRRLPGRRDR